MQNETVIESHDKALQIIEQEEKEEQDLKEELKKAWDAKEKRLFEQYKGNIPT